MSLTPFWALTRKDLRVFASDRRAVVITVAVPLALAAFMGTVMGGGGGGGKIAVAWVDQDHSPLALELGRALAAEPDLAVTPTSLDEARAQVGRGKASVAVVLPAGFGRAAPKALFGASAKPELTLLYDPSDTAELAMARGILIQHAMQAVSREAFGGNGGVSAVQELLAELPSTPGLAADDQRALSALYQSVLALNPAQATNAATRSTTTADAARAGGGLTLPYDTREEAVAGSGPAQYNSYAHAFAGMTVQFLLFLSIETGGAILLERQRGLWRRLRAAPLSRRTVLASRATSGALLALAITAVLFLFGRLVFGVRMDGSVFGFALVAVAFALTSSTFGLLLATTAATPQAMRGGATFVVLVLTMLGGAWMPSFMFPAWMQTATRATPTRWAMEGFEAMTWRGLPWTEALAPAGVLLGFALVFGVIAVLRFRWEAE